MRQKESPSTVFLSSDGTCSVNTKWKAAHYVWRPESTRGSSPCSSQGMGSGNSRTAEVTEPDPTWIPQGNHRWPTQTHHNRRTTGTQGHNRDGKMSMQRRLHITEMFLPLEGFGMHSRLMSVWRSVSKWWWLPDEHFDWWQWRWWNPTTKWQLYLCSII